MQKMCRNKNLNISVNKGRKMKKAAITVSLFAMVSLMFVGGANAMMQPPGSTTTPCEIGVFSGGSWFLDMGGTGMWNSMMDTMMSFGTGLDGAMPVAGDWNGTGTTSIGVYDPGTGTWYLDMNGNDAWDGTPTDATYTFGAGMTGAIPVTGDWKGTGKTNIGIFDPSTGNWYLDMNGDGMWDGTTTDTMYTFGTGLKGAVPISGKW
jgi:hypothetical protein